MPWGYSDALLTPHALYTGLAADDAGRHARYRALFRHSLDAEAIADIRLALHQSQPLGNARFMDTIERMTGQRREAKPRGRPRAKRPEGGALEGPVQIELNKIK